MPQIQDTEVRYLREEDILSILELAKEPVKAVFPGKVYEEDKIQKLCDAALLNDNITGIVLVIAGSVKGFILGIITEHYFHSSKMAYCMAIFVKEEARKYGIEMLKAFESWGKYKKAETLHIGTYTNLSPEHLGRLYQRLGYQAQEVIYKKEV